VPDRPLVTIVTPSFNQGAYLEEAIVSVLKQDYERIEYVVVDGGSTDGSVEIIRRYADRLAWWESKPDDGQAAALNDAFARSRGELLGWVNSDDTLLPGSVTTMVEALHADTEALFVYGDTIYIDSASHRTGYSLSRDLDVVLMARTCTHRINPMGGLFRRYALELAGPLEGFYCWDFELMLRLGMVGPAVQVERPIATFRLHENSKTMSSASLKAQDYLEMYDRLFRFGALTDEVRAVEAEARAASLLFAGQLFYLDGDHRRARRCYLEALRLHPQALSPRTASYVARALLPPPLLGRLRAARSWSRKVYGPPASRGPCGS
jgi:glycosyltransferase involved in cell wall biosynthesis